MHAHSRSSVFLTSTALLMLVKSFFFIKIGRLERVFFFFLYVVCGSVHVIVPEILTKKKNK